jgi:hypothetical protein
LVAGSNPAGVAKKIKVLDGELNVQSSQNFALGRSWEETIDAEEIRMAEIAWNECLDENAVPKDRRLLLIGKPVGGTGPDLVVGHWHEGNEFFVAAEIPSERQGARPEFKVSWWAEMPKLPEGIELRPLALEDMKG